MCDKMAITTIVLLIIAILWTLFWDGWALWVAGNKKEKGWFVVLFLVHTLGKLDIYYLHTRKRL